MVRVYLLVIAVLVAAEIFALVDLSFSDPARVRGVPKPVWVLVILFIPVVGFVLWFTVGRPRRHGGSGGGSGPRPVAPDDDPDFLRRLGRDINPDGTPPKDSP